MLNSGYLCPVTVDFLIIGQGISGTFLSFYLEKAGKSFHVIDNGDLNSPSRISAGVINPVTGRRLVKVWMAEEIIPFASKAYHDIGESLSLPVISQKNLVDFFPNPHQRQVFMERIAENNGYLHSFPEQNRFNPFFNYELGCGEIRHCYIADLSSLLPAWRRHLEKSGRISHEKFDSGRLETRGDGIKYDLISAEKIIFCDGLSSFENPFFKNIPFAPNKGEALLVEINGLPGDNIYKKGFLLVPGKDENTFWFGSNYQWKFDHPGPTKEFLEQAERHLRAWCKLPYRILAHLAGLRPATLERRPFVGLHPHQPAIGILNGMGTKGCSLAPFFANQLTEMLVNNTAISPEAGIARFTKLLGN